MKVIISDDFDLQKICYSGQCFRCTEVQGFYRFIFQNHVLYIRHLESEYYDINCNEDDWNKIWIPYFDLSRNYAHIRNLVLDDLFMTKASDAGAGIRILKQDAWEMLITFILSQRKSIPAIKKSVETLCKTYGNTIETACETLYLFPSADAIYNADMENLAQCGLGYRLPYIKDAATRVVNQSALIDSWNSFDDETLLTTLKTIKGVGDKVANCIMLFAYGRTASAPVDTWIKKIMETYYDGQNPFLKYGDSAGIMQQYAFYYIQQHKTEV